MGFLVNPAPTFSFTSRPNYKKMNLSPADLLQLSLAYSNDYRGCQKRKRILVMNSDWRVSLCFTTCLFKTKIILIPELPSYELLSEIFVIYQILSSLLLFLFPPYTVKLGLSFFDIKLSEFSCHKKFYIVHDGRSTAMSPLMMAHYTIYSHVYINIFLYFILWLPCSSKLRPKKQKHIVSFLVCRRTLHTSVAPLDAII